MTRGERRCAAALLGLTLLVNLALVAVCGNGLSPVADSYSEANALRAGERYARDGYFVDAGLPWVSFGPRFPDVGIVGESGRVYHGYPPGPDWLAGLYTRAFGVGNLALFRMPVLAIGMIGAATFLFGLTRAVGPARGLAVYAACLLTPMFTSMTHSLHCHGYVFSLLLVEVGLLLTVLSRPGPVGPGPVAALLGLGFVQGWLSFDLCFLVTFAPVPIALLAAPAGARPRWGGVLALSVAAGAGFTLAHVLHFLQSVAYFGSLAGALDEYASRAGKVYGLAGTSLESAGRPTLIAAGLWLMARSYMRWTHLFSPMSTPVTAAAIGVFLLSRASATLRRRFRFDAAFAPRPMHLAGAASALTLGIAWLLAKPQHAINHLTFIGRHLFLFYLCCCLMVARGTVLRFGWTRGREAHWWPSRDVLRAPGEIAVPPAGGPDTDPPRAAAGPIHDPRGTVLG